MAEDSKVTGWKDISSILYYFVLYVFLAYALKLSLISLNDLVSSIILTAITVIIGVALAYKIVKST